MGAVLGQMATGGGASNLQQVMASVGVASMSKSTFTATERYITEDIKSLLVHLSWQNRTPAGSRNFKVFRPLEMGAGPKEAISIAIMQNPV